MSVFIRASRCSLLALLTIAASTLAIAQSLPPTPSWIASPKRGQDGRLTADEYSGDRASNPRPASPELLAKPAAAGSGLLLTNRRSADQQNYPLQFAYPFSEGAIQNFPQLYIDGTPLDTQADVKLRHPDGSVKHAVISAVIPFVPANKSIRLELRNQPHTNNNAVGINDMLSAAMDFDARIDAHSEFSNGSASSVSAREMLRRAGGCAADVTISPTAPCAYWLKGPIATTVVLADHSERRTYDFGFTTSARGVRPIFHVTFWPTIRKIKVRFIGEIANPRAMQDEFYNLTLSVGQQTPNTVYQKKNWVHHAATRWTRSYWIGGEPDPMVELDYNLPQLSRTKLVANFDLNSCTDPILGNISSAWTKARTDLGEAGLWIPYMPTTGDRPDIGHYPLWALGWLCSGNTNLRQAALQQGDLAANWGLHVRESQAKTARYDARSYNPQGRTINAYTHPTLWLFDERDTASPEDQIKLTNSPRFMLVDRRSGKTVKPTRASDPLRLAGNAPGPASDLEWMDARFVPYQRAYFDGWVDDGAHQPDPFYIPYLLTGDYWYLEEMQFWAGASSLKYCVGSPWCRGRAGDAGIRDQIRGNAWVLRNRVNAAVMTPDASPEKPVFGAMVNDALSLWRGLLDIKPTNHTNTKLWQWGRSVGANGASPSPLHFFGAEKPAIEGLATMSGPGVIAAGAGISPWMQNYLLLELGQTVDMGFPAEDLLHWLGINLVQQLTHKGFNPYLSASYRMPVVKADGQYYATWNDVLLGYPPETQKSGLLLSDTTYPSIAYAALSHLDALPNASRARDELLQMLAKQSFRVQAKWAIQSRRTAPADQR